MTIRITHIETIRPPIQPNILFVLLRSADGLVGLGEAFFGSRAIEAYIHETAAEVVLKMNDVSPETVAAALTPYLGYQGSGIEVRGNAAIDLALWDLLGQVCGVPLFTLLGGTNERPLKVYNTCAGSDYVRTGTRQSSENWGLRAGAPTAGEYEDLQAFLKHPGTLARDLLDEGIRGMKIWPFDKAGEASGGNSITRRELQAGIAIVEEIRTEVGMDMDLMIELHGLWNRPAATQIINALEPYLPYWVEDPIRPDAIDALHHLSSDVSVPIAVGETSVGRRGVLSILDQGSIDILTLDLQWTGGLTEARKVATLADAYSVPIAPHDCTGPATLAACVHLSHSQPNSLVQETVRAFLRTWYMELVTGLPEVNDGHVKASPVPGHGVKLTDEVLSGPGNHRRVTSLTDV